MWAVAFQHRVTGAFGLAEDGGHLGRPLELCFAARAPSLMRLLRTGVLELRGEVQAPGFADRSSLSGELCIARREARYRFTFRDNAGRRCTFSGSQELTLRRPPAGFSVLNGELCAADRPIGAARLRFDPRTDLAELLGSVTVGKRHATEGS